MYEPITQPVKGLLMVRILMTVCVMEFFGPWGRDFSESHLFNPEWAGHARVHMMWLLGYFLFSGIGTFSLVWLFRPLRLAHLYAAFMWLGANFLGFWLAVAMVPVYDGLVVVPGMHVFILGIEENVFVFSVLSIIYLSALFVLEFRVKPNLRPAA